MKIINATFTTRLGGLEKVFLDYNDMLTCEGFEVISLIHKNSKIKDELQGKFYEDRNFSKYDPISLFNIWRILKKEKPDIIITHGNRAHYLLKKVSGTIPVIGLCHGYSFDRIKNCDYIISITKDLKKELIESNYPENKIELIPNPIKIPKDIRYQRPSFHEVPVIGAMARLEKIKGIEVLLNALAELKKKGINFQCKIAGDGPESLNLKNLSKELGVEENIDFLGWIKDKKNFYEEIDMLCVPSFEESFGLVIIEAFLHSKPLISSNAQGPAEITEEEKDALIFKTGDYKELAVLIENMIKTPDLAAFLSKNGFDKVFDYDMIKIGEKLIKFLQTVRV